VLKIQVKKPLSFTSPVSSLFSTAAPLRRNGVPRPPREEQLIGIGLALSAPKAGLVLPTVFLSTLKKHYSIFIQQLLGLVCFFGTINKSSNFFL
jgi:hypothetical protein